MIDRVISVLDGPNDTTEGIKFVGNIIFVQDIHIGEVYLPEANIIPESDALLETGALKQGYVKFETAYGVVLYARDHRYRGWAGVVYLTDNGWYVRNCDVPWELIEDCEPPYYGVITMRHLGKGSYAEANTDSIVYLSE